MVGPGHILQEVLPLMKVSEFSSMDSLVQSEPNLFHYFVDEDILCAHRFLYVKQAEAIVLTSNAKRSREAAGLQGLCVCQRAATRQVSITDGANGAYSRTIFPNHLLSMRT